MWRRCPVPTLSDQIYIQRTSLLGLNLELAGSFHSGIILARHEYKDELRNELPSRINLITHVFDNLEFRFQGQLGARDKADITTGILHTMFVSNFCQNLGQIAVLCTIRPLASIFSTLLLNRKTLLVFRFGMNTFILKRKGLLRHVL